MVPPRRDSFCIGGLWGWDPFAQTHTRWLPPPPAHPGAVAAVEAGVLPG